MYLLLSVTTVRGWAAVGRVNAVGVPGWAALASVRAVVGRGLAVEAMVKDPPRPDLQQCAQGLDAPSHGRARQWHRSAISLHVPSSMHVQARSLPADRAAPGGWLARPTGLNDFQSLGPCSRCGLEGSRIPKEGGHQRTGISRPQKAWLAHVLPRHSLKSRLPSYVVPGLPVHDSAGSTPEFIAWIAWRLLAAIAGSRTRPSVNCRSCADPRDPGEREH